MGLMKKHLVTLALGMAVSATASAQTTWIKIADEYNTFSTPSAQTVRFGADTRWVEKVVSGSGSCTNEFFGKDPAPGVAKSCMVASSAQTSTTSWIKIADEYKTFSTPSAQTVRFGADTRWVEKVVSGSGSCTNEFFGKDPAPGVAKSCMVASVSTAPVATVPVHSMWQAITGDVKINSSVSVYGYTSKSTVPGVLSTQAVNLGTAALLQPEFRAEFPGLADAEMTVMQLIVTSRADAPTFSSDTKTVAPKNPLAIKVPAGKKLWVIYSAPAGAPGELRFYVGSPPPTTTTSTTTSGGAS